MAFFDTMKQVGSDEAGGVFIDGSCAGKTYRFYATSGGEWFYRDKENLPASGGDPQYPRWAKGEWARWERAYASAKREAERVLKLRWEIRNAKQAKPAPKLGAKESKASNGVRCPYCHDSATGPDLDLCDQCHALSHSACTEEHGGCAACGTKWDLHALPARTHDRMSIWSPAPEHVLLGTMVVFALLGILVGNL